VSAPPVQAALLTVQEIFGEAGTSYVIPIYQRNYAWREEQIEQLIDDVWTAAQDADQEQYFLGNLVVAERRPSDSSKPGRILEVIDGQQRLTTLALLRAALDGDDSQPALRLRYASRPGATAALSNLESSDDEDGTGIHTAYKIIQQALESKIGSRHRDEFARFLRQHVRLVRATLLTTTDLNRYFEIMNTRGQQLQQVDIVKARLVRHLAHDPAAQACFSWIWDGCADMDAYIQMTLTRVRENRSALRGRIFGADWDRLCLTRFRDLTALHQEFAVAAGQRATDQDDGRSLASALASYAAEAVQPEEEDQESSRFRSPVGFSSFLLHVLKVLDSTATDRDDGDEGQLDDNKLIKLFDARFNGLTGAEARTTVTRFAETLLRCRFVFDNYLLKREFTATNGDDGEWSLRRLARSRSEKATPWYPAAFASNDGVDDSGDPTARQMLLLQSMLRVTYTSPRTMHWITAVLRIPNLEQHGPASARLVRETLETFARARVRQAFFAGDEATGFAIERIVFTYIDYLLAKNSDPGYRFSFRNSIEHFFPQWPDPDQASDVVPPRGLHSLGNLALISVGANSKFSNNLPKLKLSFRPLIEQSPKLRLMADQAAVGTWHDEAIEQHRAAMVTLLRADLGFASER